MWMEEGQRNILEEDNEIDSDTSGEELPIWVRGEQRWVSGIIAETTCQDIVTVLVRDEISRVRGLQEILIKHKINNIKVLLGKMYISTRTLPHYRKMERC